MRGARHLARGEAISAMRVPRRRPGLALLSILLVAGASKGTATPTVDPCSREGQAWITHHDVLSKPAHGLLEETDPKWSLTERLHAIDDPNAHADQCRAVLGPIPRINCYEGTIVPVTVNGSPVTYHGGTLYKDGAPTDRSVLDWCDKPALIPFLFKPPLVPGGRGADPKEGCLPNVRFGHIKVGPVDWMFICHNKTGLHEPEQDSFDFITLIGSNRNTGETCFIGHDNSKHGPKTDGVHVPVPGGEGPLDRYGREAAARFWNDPSINTCLRCHSVNKPWLLTPHLNQSRLGGDGSMDLLPETPRERRVTPGWGYRVIGVVHNWVFPRPKAIVPKHDDGTADHTCLHCHVLTDQEPDLRLARESVGLGEMAKYADRTQLFPLDRTAWMPPHDYAVGSALKKWQEAVLRYERAFGNPSFRAAESEILSPCPPPKELARKRVQRTPEGVRWSYQTDLGDVATRDDIRFRIRIEGSDGSACEFRDVAPSALGSKHWGFDHPRKTGVRYGYEIEPYRYCFDRTGFLHGKATKIPMEEEK